MEPKLRWGITLPLPGIALADQREIVAGLPGLGYTDAWSSEVNGTDAFTPLVLAAQWASELRLGTAIAPIYTRGPAVLAMSGATLAGLAPGRFVLGIGTSSPAVVERWNAAELDRPYQRARDMLSFLRQALTGEKVTKEYETFRVDGFRLEPAPATPPALALAALRPQMIRLAAAKADAAITNWLAPHDVPMVRAVAGPGCELVARIFVCPTPPASAPWPHPGPARRGTRRRRARSCRPRSSAGRSRGPARRRGWGRRRSSRPARSRARPRPGPSARHREPASS